MKYTVTVYRIIREPGTIEVDAPDADEAKDAATEAEQTVTCHQFTGTLAFGKLVLTPSPKEKSQEQKDAEYIAEIMQAFQELGPSELRDAIEYGRKHPTP